MRLLLPLLALLGTAPPQTARLPVPSGELAYEVAGPASAPAVVLLHGAFMDKGTWDQEFPVLARDFRVVRYDIRPFGESTRPEQPYSVPDDLLRVLDHLQIDRAFLMGHSFGGALALDFALLHPERVAGLVLVIGDRDTPGNQQGAELVASRVAGAAKRVIAGADHGVPVGWSDELVSAAVGFMRAARR